MPSTKSDKSQVAILQVFGKTTRIQTQSTSFGSACSANCTRLTINNICNDMYYTQIVERQIKAKVS